MQHRHERSEEAAPTHGGHSHDQDSDHQGEPNHGHDYDHDHSRLSWLREAIPFLAGHSHGETNVDAALEGSALGLWALKVSLVGLGLTAAFQLVFVLISGSVGLLADTIHNASDALTAIPLGIAFVLAKRPPTRRYTYGYGRAEDVAGVIIVGIIFLSALVAAYESIQKLLHPQPLHYLGWVMAAAIVGFVGNEAVAVFRIRVGREIGSAALIADGQHARIDGLTSLAVLAGALGVWAGFSLADPLVGLLITVAILFIVKETALTMWRRLMDAVEPEVVDRIERVAAAVPGVEAVHDVRARWHGHKLQAELHVTIDEELPTREGHRIVEEVRHLLFHAQPRLAVVEVHVDPCGHGGPDPHAVIAHHRHPIDHLGTGDDVHRHAEGIASDH
jgi:cation diffusion facilitator family transporter